MKKQNNSAQDSRIIATDLIMITVLVVNLLWLSFEWLFENRSIHEFIRVQAPEFFNFYNTNIHNDVARIDIIFVAIFLIEFSIRWGLAIARKTYYKWYFYPIIHWYDVLGLIPVGYMRILRVLRVFSIIYRLQHMGMIDIRKTYVYKQFDKVRNIISEEISDRVVINIIENSQEEIRNGRPTQQNILHKVVAPHKQDIVNWVTYKAKSTAETHYLPNKDKFRHIVKENVAQIMDNNESVEALEKIPIVGKALSKQLEDTISDTMLNTIDSVIYTMLIDENNQTLQNLTAEAFDAFVSPDKDPELERITQEITLNALEEVKAQVAYKQWQHQQDSEDAFLDMA